MADKHAIKPRAVALVFWRVLKAYLYYPFLIGAAVWIYVKDAHILWAVALVGFVWLYDPVIHLFRRNLRRRAKNSRHFDR